MKSAKTILHGCPGAGGYDHGYNFRRGARGLSYTSIRGQQVMIYGKGVYQHMSADVAPQGIAQNVVTPAIGIALLLSLGGTGKVQSGAGFC
jgi:hypothetical protein